MSRWIPCPEGHHDAVTLSGGRLALLTLRDTDGRLHVGFYPEWCCNDVLAYMDVEPFSSSAPAGWKSEFHGDELPEESGWYLVTVEPRKVEKSWFDGEKYRWCREKGRPEVLAWRELPMPYQERWK